jgi:hypothetical protein
METSGGDSGIFWKIGCAISLMAAVQPEPWLWALITTNNNYPISWKKNILRKLIVP